MFMKILYAEAQNCERVFTKISPKSQLLLLGNFHLIFQSFLLFGAFFSIKVKVAQSCPTLQSYEL